MNFTLHITGRETSPYICWIGSVCNIVIKNKLDNKNVSIFISKSCNGGEALQLGSQSMLDIVEYTDNTKYTYSTVSAELPPISMFISVLV